MNVFHDRYALPAGWQVRARLMWQSALDFGRACMGDLPLLTRAGSHVGLLSLVVLTVLVGRIPLNPLNPLGGLLLGGTGGPNVVSDTDSDTLFLSPSPLPDLPFLSAAPLPDIPNRSRADISTYTVQPGDTVTGIAAQFGITPESILWANPKLEDNPDFLSLGQTLNIPPTSGVLYTVQSGDTLAKIVDKFKGKQSADAILQALVSLDFNKSRHDLESSSGGLRVGQFLMVPGGVKPDTSFAVTAIRSSTTSATPRKVIQFGWPVGGRITQSYWSRHRGIDIGAPLGTTVRAPNAGTVVAAGWDNRGYGNMILLDNGNGYQTRFGHLSEIDVQVGQAVQKGELIGRVGSTGHSTGPHLHFEIILNGVNRNPFGFLR